MIRHANPTDVSALVALGRVMHSEAPCLRHAAYDEGKVENALLAAMQNGLVLVHEEDGRIDGAFVGMVGERWFSRDRYFVDLALFVDPARRGGLTAYRLLRAVIAWCKEQGLAPHDVTLGISTGVHPEETGRFFEHLGFERFGGLYRLGAY